jgi:hypothetical protein
MFSLPVVLGIVGVVALAWSVFHFVVIAQPDEWLLRIRNGRLVDAGVGIWLLRRPGDRVARFSSTVQRVAFVAEGSSSERLGVAVEGFILWSVAATDDAPFVAFRKLGIANLAGPGLPPGHDRRHLLTRPQYHAFQRMLAATVQRQIATWCLDDLLGRQDDLVTELRGRVNGLTQPLGLSLEEVELTRVLPAEHSLVRELAAPREQEVREVAERARREMEERLERRSLEAAAALAEQRAATEREQLEQRARVEARQRELAQLAALRACEDEREVARRRAELAHEEVDARVRRDRLALDAELEGKRRRVEVRREAIESLAAAEGNKSQAVRDYELARLATVKMAESLALLPLERAEWVTFGDESPATALAGLLAAARRVAKV